MRFIGLVSGSGFEYDRPSRGFSDPVAAAALARVEREEQRSRPLRSRSVRQVRPASDFGRALMRALEGVVLD